MKKLIITSLIIAFGSISAQKAKPQTNKIDPKLVGMWKGGEKDQQIAGMEKLWVMDRRADGTFALIFTTVEDCEIEQHVERGQWWIENGEFHELHFVSGKTDVYSYSVPDASHVKFTSKDMAIKMATGEAYSFVDTKIEDGD